MSNKLRGNVDLKIGESKYTLCYGHGALIELEELLDKGIAAISDEISLWQKEPERIRLKWIRAMLYAGLKKNHPRLTLEDVDDIMDEAGKGSQLMDAIGEAMSAAFGSSAVPEGDARPTNGDARSGTGIVSSPNTSPSDTN